MCNPSRRPEVTGEKDVAISQFLIMVPGRIPCN